MRWWSPAGYIWPSSVRDAEARRKPAGSQRKLQEAGPVEVHRSIEHSRPACTPSMEWWPLLYGTSENTQLLHASCALLAAPIAPTRSLSSQYVCVVKKWNSYTIGFMYAIIRTAYKSWRVAADQCSDKADGLTNDELCSPQKRLACQLGSIYNCHHFNGQAVRQPPRRPYAARL